MLRRSIFFLAHAPALAALITSLALVSPEAWGRTVVLDRSDLDKFIPFPQKKTMGAIEHKIENQFRKAGRSFYAAVQSQKPKDEGTRARAKTLHKWLKTERKGKGLSGLMTVPALQLSLAENGQTPSALQLASQGRTVAHYAHLDWDTDMMGALWGTTRGKGGESGFLKTGGSVNKAANSLSSIFWYTVGKHPERSHVAGVLNSLGLPVREGSRVEIDRRLINGKELLGVSIADERYGTFGTFKQFEVSSMPSSTRVYLRSID